MYLSNVAPCRPQRVGVGIDAESKQIVIGLVRILIVVEVTLSHGANYRFSGAVIPNCFDMKPDVTR